MGGEAPGGNHGGCPRCPRGWLAWPCAFTSPTTTSPASGSPRHPTRCGKPCRACTCSRPGTAGRSSAAGGPGSARPSAHRNTSCCAWPHRSATRRTSSRPPPSESGLEPGIDALLSTPRARLRHDVLELSADGRRLPPWGRALADGDGAAVHHLGRTLRTYVRAGLAPYWDHVRARFEAERALRTRTPGVGSGSLLDALHPELHWRPPVLTVGGLRVERDVHLRGRGLLVLPSYFCWRYPTVLRDAALPPVVVYPMTHQGALNPADRVVEATPGHRRGPWPRSWGGPGRRSSATPRRTVPRPRNWPTAPASPPPPPATTPPYCATRACSAPTGWATRSCTPPPRSGPPCSRGATARPSDARPEKGLSKAL